MPVRMSPETTTRSYWNRLNSETLSRDDAVESRSFFRVLSRLYETFLSSSCKVGPAKKRDTDRYLVAKCSDLTPIIIWPKRRMADPRV